MSALVSPAMESAVGATVRRRRSHPVTANDVRRWAVAARWPEPLPARFATAPEADLVVPADLNPFAWSCAEDTLSAAGLDIGDPGWIEKIAGVATPPVLHQLNGGIEDTYVAQLRVGDTVVSHTTIDGYAERSGRLGPMLFTTLADTWTDQRGVVVKRTSMVLIRH